MSAGLRAGIIPVTPFQQNCSLVCCTVTGRAAVIDPGGDIDRILAAAEQENMAIEKILVTHGHLDHAGGVAELAQRLSVPIEGPHKDDQFWIDRLEGQGARFGFGPCHGFVPDRWLDDGDTVTIGAQTLSVLHCPGHTPGHIVFYHAPSRLAIVGDVLFNGSVGRSDFPGGNHDVLVRSIRDKLFPLGDDVTFISGHGPTSTFGAERMMNPFVSDLALGLA